MTSTPKPPRGREAKKRQRSSGAALGKREQTSRVYISVPVNTGRVAGLMSTAMVDRFGLVAIVCTTLSYR
jgi:hypothetical protein